MSGRDRQHEALEGPAGEAQASAEARILADFVALSELLTGYEPGALAADGERAVLARQYLEVLRRHVPEDTIARLLGAFRRLMGAGESAPLELERRLQAEVYADAELRPLAANIIKLWYLGIWYEPPGQARFGYVMSAEAYQRGLVWEVIQAHPPGYSRQAFGYWSEQPGVKDRG